MAKLWYIILPPVNGNRRRNDNTRDKRTAWNLLSRIMRPKLMKPSPTVCYQEAYLSKRVMALPAGITRRQEHQKDDHHG
jgi:hypothetical protein